MDPVELVDPRRLDLVVKYLFFRALVRQRDVAYFEQIYRRHIERRTGGIEPADHSNGAVSSKCSVDDYVVECHALLASMQRHGFILQYPVPVTADGQIANGAHRIACALALGLRVPITRCDKPGPAWNAAWFAANGFSEEEIAELFHAWSLLRSERAAVFILWPAVAKHWPVLEMEIARNFTVVGSREFDFGSCFETFASVVYDIYSYGTTATTLPHIDRKLATFRSFAPCFRVVLAFNASPIEATGEMTTRTKRQLRLMLNEHVAQDQYITCHGSDSAAELIYLADTLLDPANTRWFGLRPNRPARPELLDWICRFRTEIHRQGVPVEDCCVVGSSSLEVFGIRYSTDLDFTVTKRWRAKLFGPGVTHLVDWVDVVTEGYHRVAPPENATSDDELIMNSRHHFLVRGVKFANLEIVKDRKAFSRRPKDLADLDLLVDFANRATAELALAPA